MKQLVLKLFFMKGAFRGPGLITGVGVLPLCLVIGVFALCVNSCSGRQSDVNLPSHRTLIRLYAMVNTPSLRSEEAGSVSFKPGSTIIKDDQTHMAESYEDKISRIRLVILDSSSNVIYNRVYGSAADELSFERKFLNGVDGKLQTVLQMVVELAPGDYKLKLIANEPDPSSVKYVNNYWVNKIITPAELQGSQVGLPMSGEADIKVKPNISEEIAKGNSPEPHEDLLKNHFVISLQRQVAKLEFHITNIDDSKDPSEVYYNSRNARIKNLFLYRANESYHFFDDTNPDPIDYLHTEGEPAGVYRHDVTHGVGEKYNDIFIVYMTPSIINDENKAVMVRVNTEYVYGYDDPQQKHLVYFDVPIVSVNSGDKYFSIKPNTVYHIDAVLKGKQLLIPVPVLVKEWTKYSRTIEVKPNTDNSLINE